MAGHSGPRRPHGELKLAMRDWLMRHGKEATISEIEKGVEPVVGAAPKSSYRSGLQDERYFERVSRGVFKAKES